MYYKYLKLKGLFFENEEILRQILANIGISLNYKSIIMKFLSSYKAMDLLLTLNKPKIAVMECPYGETGFGYVYAFKKRNVKVIELQHGVINSSHYAYNSLLKNKWYGDDYLFVFGEKDRKCFQTENTNYIDNENIRVTGHFLLSKYTELKVKDPFIYLKVKYENCSSCWTRINGTTDFKLYSTSRKKNYLMLLLCIHPEL